jgi:predicted RNA-binding protein YlqC (UPF0109 family)
MSDESGNAQINPVRAVVEVVARALVDHPDAVKVHESSRRGMMVLELTTAPGDMGKIIGRQGRTAAALRTLVAVTAERHGCGRSWISAIELGRPGARRPDRAGRTVSAVRSSSIRTRISWRIAFGSGPRSGRGRLGAMSSSPSHRRGCRTVVR